MSRSIIESRGIFSQHSPASGDPRANRTIRSRLPSGNCLRSQPGPVVRIRFVGLILAPRDPAFLQLRSNLISPPVERGPQERKSTTRRGNLPRSREPLQARAARQPHQHRFHNVIGMVTGRDPSGPLKTRPACLLEEGKPSLASLGFADHPLPARPSGLRILELDTKIAAQFSYELRVRS